MNKRLMVIKCSTTYKLYESHIPPISVVSILYRFVGQGVTYMVRNLLKHKPTTYEFVFLTR